MKEDISKSEKEFNVEDDKINDISNEAKTDDELRTDDNVVENDNNEIENDNNEKVIENLEEEEKASTKSSKVTFGNSINFEKYLNWVKDNKKIVVISIVPVIAILFIMIIYSNRDTRIDISKYITYKYSGIDGMGVVEHEFDKDKFESDIYKNEKNSNILSNLQKMDEVYQCTSGYEVEFDKKNELKNGDLINVDIKINPLCTLAKSNTVKIKVSELSEGIEIDNQELMDKTLVEFSGTSGKGEASVRSLFKGDLSSINMVVNPSKDLSNGDKVKVSFDEEGKQLLSILGYKLSESGEVEFTVENLKVIPDQSSQIKNIEDVTRILKEKIESKFGGSSYTYTGYEIKSNLYFAKYIAPNADINDSWSHSFNDGSLGYIVFVTSKYSDKQEKYFMGFGDVILDDQNNAQINKLSLSSKKYDSNYSFESITKIIEADGFKTE